MITWLQRNPLIAALALVTVGLAALLAIQVGLIARAPVDEPAKRATPAEARLLPPVPAVTAEQAYAETATRPLFVPTRRPAPELAVAAAPAFRRGQFTLQGVIIVGDNRTALLREKSTGRIHRVETGREVNGVKVIKIDPQAVTMGVGDEREAVPLVVQRHGAGTTAAPSIAAATQGPFAGPGVPPATPSPPHAVPPGGQPLTTGGPAFPFPTAPNESPAPSATAPPGAAQPAAAPMSPEELLARRRARRAQQNQ
ncbi:MAG TPA: hypothetical protein VFK48_02565 [Usitatibacter sp.]|nr:hypothetical protein [Usitatibacter sp.]